MVTPPLAAVPDLEHELDWLYGLPLDEFTKARNDLAARLKRAHQADASAAIRSLRKPGTVAWAANQLARHKPGQVATLLETGERIRETQQRTLAGEASADELADAITAERTAIRALLTSARSALGARGTAAIPLLVMSRVSIICSWVASVSSTPAAWATNTEATPR